MVCIASHYLSPLQPLTKHMSTNSKQPAPPHEANSQPLPPPLTDQQQQIVENAEAIEARSNRGWGPGGVAKQPAPPRFDHKQLEAIKIWEDIDKQDKRGWNRSKHMGYADMLRVEFTLKNLKKEKAAALAEQQKLSKPDRRGQSVDQPARLTKPRQSNNSHN